MVWQLIPLTPPLCKPTLGRTAFLLKHHRPHHSSCMIRAEQLKADSYAMIESSSLIARDIWLHISKQHLIEGQSKAA